MLLFLLISLPIFAVIAIGWIVGRRGLPDERAAEAGG
jgi:predicted permease